ncbi:unnamed protein product, partial [Rotaria sp. Silwood1]
MMFYYQLMEHEMKLLVRKAFLRVLHDVILRILTNTRQLCVSSFYIALLLQWIHILNMLDYTQEACWSPILTPS